MKSIAYSGAENLKAITKGDGDSDFEMFLDNALEMFKGSNVMIDINIRSVSDYDRPREEC